MMKKFLLFYILCGTLFNFLLVDAADPVLTVNLLEELCENTPVNTVIGSFSVIGGTPNYQITILDFQFSAYVSIENGGIITTDGGKVDVTLDRALDRESIGFFPVTVAVGDDQGQSDLVETNGIVIKDVNDNNPVFLGAPFTESVYEYPWTENLAISFEVSDSDTSAAGSVSVSINNDKLDLVRDGVTNKYTLRLQPGIKIDYEESPVITAELTATDGGGGCGSDTSSRSTTTTVVINVKDGPNKAPAFVTFYDVDLAESSSVTTPVVRVQAIDRDYILNWDMVYAITSSSVQANWFTIDPNTGVISVNEEIDRENDDALSNDGIIRLEVEATEVVPDNYPLTPQPGYPFPLTATTTVTIRITDENDNDPKFYDDSTGTRKEADMFETYMEENTPNQISVPGLSIFVQDKDQGGNAEFSLENDGQVFEVFPTEVQGEANVLLRIVDSSALDFETTKSLTVKILAKPSDGSSGTATATVTIYLNDTNDNSPEFESSVLSANVSEDANVGDFVVQVKATDKDSGINQEITYSLPETDIFAIDATTGIITLAEPLDREQLGSYFLTVTATDGGGRSTNANLQITVVDVNDHPPIFQRSSYTGTVEENANEFRTSLEISATDDDQQNTPNSDIQFTIIEGDLKDYFTVVTNDSNSVVSVGTVTVVQPIDLESLDPDLIQCSESAIETTLVVKAEDQGNPPQSSTVTLSIIVEDVNDQDPEFNQTVYEGSIEELSPFGTFILQVFATDSDACEPNNDVIYQIDQTSDLEILNSFQINSRTGEISVRDPTLNRDDKETYTFTVLALDGGDGDRMGSAEVAISLIDVNDKPPTFTSDRTVYIEEEQNEGTVVWIVEASDTDINSNLSYSKSNIRCFKGDIEDQVNCVDPFTMENDFINQVGNMVVSSRIDRETFSRYVLQVTVVDLNANEKPLQTVSEIFEIFLTDINDNTPEFNVDSENFQIIEEASNVLVGTVIAEDPDEGENGEVVYSISESDADKYNVVIDPVTGIITTEAGVDREEVGDVALLTVFAQDKGSPSLLTSVVLSIEIEDVNDQTPVFVEPQYAGNVSEDAARGEEVVVVNATDADVGFSAQIRYSITNGDVFAQFRIDGDTGVISVGKSLDHESIPAYTLTVTARDENGGSGGLSAQVLVFIEVSDVNDNAPEFAAEIYPVLFPEDASVGDEVESQFATDADEGENSEFEYFIINDAVEFDIDSNSGIVRLASSIANGEARYSVDIMARDKGDPPLNSSYTLQINVEAANLNDPVFNNLPPTDRISIKENMPAGTDIYQVNATDKDRGNFGRVTYSLEDEDAAFGINPTTGWIFSYQIFNRENKDSYVVTVIARDGDSSPRSSSVTFTIYIDDVDDNSPFYPVGENEQSFEVNEEEQTGLINPPIKQAEDEDEEQNSINYYFIIGGSASGNFLLDSSSRILNLVTPLDREVSPQYDLVVTVVKDPDFVPPTTDVTWESVQGNSTMLHAIIIVKDINDNPPVFTKSEYFADVPINSQPGEDAVITQVLARDRDEGENAEVTYAVDSTSYMDGGAPVDASGVFGILKARDGLSGDLYLASALTGDITGEYTVVVSATDAGDQKTTSTIIVGIIDSDESVTLFSLMSQEEFYAQEEKFVADLEELLEATVVIDRVQPHEKEDESDTAQLDITFHAKVNGSTELVSRDDIINTLSGPESSAFLLDYGIIDVQSNIVIEDRTQEFLTAGLIIAGSLILVIIVCFTIAIICMRRKYNRKLKVMEATNSAAHEMADMNAKANVLALPNTNDYAGGENPLFTENQKNAIDLDGFLINQESADDDEIDDNAVDNYDSAIAVNMFDGSTKSNESDDGQDLEDGQFDIDFNRGDNARLAAALNAANERRGGENLTYIFDQVEDNTSM